MTATLVRKLLRDVRLTLLVVAVFLCLFQVLWARVTERILGKLNPFFAALAGMGGLTTKDVEAMIFEGPGKIIRTVLGGDRVQLDTAMDMLSIGYVHPLMQILFCVWAVGRAAGAVAGEIDRGTMELLLAQPVARSRLILSHLLVDAVTIPALCLSLWAGNAAGAWLITPIQVEEPTLKLPAARPGYLVEFGPFRLRVDDPLQRKPRALTERDREAMQQRLAVEPAKFGPALVLVGGLIFGVGGITMAISARGRSRWRVLGVAVFLALVMFLLNVLGQMWDDAAWLRPLTIFYYYQPQQLILSGDWCVTLSEWNGGSPLVRLPMPLMLYGVGAVGYLLALVTLVRRDLPAPL
ncbi:MAG: ABC transporter permease subunit [Gemmataceae bacterium]